MKCTVCGKELGLWERLNVRPSLIICKGCREQANEKMQALLRSSSTTQSFNRQFAQNWMTQLEETVRKYQMPQVEAGPQRLALLTNIFALAESGDEIADADLRFLAELGQKYQLWQFGNPEVKDAIIRIGMREVIQNWERGESPRKDCAGLVLQKGELCHWEEGAGLLIQKTHREYVGGSASVSFKNPLIPKSRFKIGAFKGVPIDKTVLENKGTGVLHITNTRLCFSGQTSIAIAFNKMLHLEGCEQGFVVHTSNDRKPCTFVVHQPELTLNMLNLAMHPPEEEPPPKGRKKLSRNA
jgi:hypothetical protein